jgi:acyl-CoA synthetase (AMP-forming)/AMP-acid ligase II
MTEPRFINTAAALVEMAQRQPEGAAIIEPQGTHREVPRSERRLSYRELDAESDCLARGLARLGVTRGMRTVLMVPPSLEFYALTFALFKLGAVVVLIDPGLGIRNLGRCLGEAAPEVFIGVPKAHLARVLLGWARRTVRLGVTVGRRLLWGGWTLEKVRRVGQASGGLPPEPVLALTEADETAAILFTSGSTGVAKGAVYTHGIFAAQVAYLKSMYGIEPGEIDLPTFPLFGLFGPALGMTAVIPEMDATRPATVDPRGILNTIAHYGVTNLFGSPALLRRVGSWPQFVGHTPALRALPTLRRVISAGAPVPAPVIQRFTELLSAGVQVHTPYGATEALPVSTIGSDEILCETAAATTLGKGVCVGRPVDGMSVRIVRIDDGPIPIWSDDLLLPQSEIGEIVVQGPVVTRSYFNRPEATMLHKIDDPARGSFWHRMGDVGYFDDKGRLWFCGRKSQRVVTANGTLFTIPCEGVFNAHPGVVRSALVGARIGRTVVPVICVERFLVVGRNPDASLLVRELIARAEAHEHTRTIRHFLIHLGFPVDIRHNAKIFREKLAEWASRQLEQM